MLTSDVLPSHTCRYDEFQEPSDEDVLDDAYDEYYETRQV